MTSRARLAAAPGFTLIEVILIVAVLAILAAAVTPALMQRLVDARIERTRAETRAIYEAIAGKPEQGSFGFFGDMGRYPATFAELAQPGQAPAFSTATFRGVGVGWNGPYVRLGDSAGDFLTDGFGRPYEGASIGQVRSAGPDGVFGNEDDIVYPPTPPNLTSRVVVTLKRMSTEDRGYTVDPPLYEVRLFYAAEGRQAFLADSDPPFAFENVPQGLHAIAVNRAGGDTMVYQDTFQTFGNGATKLVEIVFGPGAAVDPVPDEPPPAPPGC